MKVFCDDIIIVKANKEDISSLIKLKLELFFEEDKYQTKKTRPYESILKNKNLILEKNFNEQIKSKNKIIFVAKINNSVIGYIKGNVWENDSFFKSKKIGIINDIVITKKFRGNKISTMLYEEIQNWFKSKKCKLSNLHVLSKNPAIEIYKKWGYETIVLGMTKPL